MLPTLGQTSQLTAQPTAEADGALLNNQSLVETSYPTEIEMTSNQSSTTGMPTTIHTDLPTLTPTKISNDDGSNLAEPCNVCVENGMVVTDLETEVADPATGETFMCALLEQRGIAGYMTAEECERMQIVAQDKCDCKRSSEMTPRDVSSSPLYLKNSMVVLSCVLLCLTVGLIFF